MMNELPKAIICDLDGTLAVLGNRNPYDASQAESDELNHPVANILEVYSHQTLFDLQIVLLTGRENRFRPQTERWLQAHDIHYSHLHMRKDGDRRKDTVVKREIYEQFIQPQYEVLFVLEDRDQVVAMWRRELGLTCLQVGYGAF